MKHDHRDGRCGNFDRLVAFCTVRGAKNVLAIAVFAGLADVLPYLWDSSVRCCLPREMASEIAVQIAQEQGPSSAR